MSSLTPQSQENLANLKKCQKGLYWFYSNEVPTVSTGISQLLVSIYMNEDVDCFTITKDAPCTTSTTLYPRTYTAKVDGKEKTITKQYAVYLVTSPVVENGILKNCSRENLETYPYPVVVFSYSPPHESYNANIIT